MRTLSMTCALLLSCLAVSLAQPTVTIEGLLGEMVDMQRSPKRRSQGWSATSSPATTGPA